MPEIDPSALERLNAEAARTPGRADRLLFRLRRVRPGAIPGILLRKVRKRVYIREEVRMYSMEIDRIDTATPPRLMNVDSVEDLLKYRPTESWQQMPDQFFGKIADYYEQGFHSYSLVEGDTLLHYGWLIERQKISNVTEVDQEFELPDDTAVLFDYYTHPQARGKGLYRKSLLQGLADAARVPGTRQVFIATLADNTASRHVIEKLGFEHRASLFRETKWGRVRKWQE